MEEVTNLIPTKVSEEMNHDLIKDFSAEEVRTALRQMHLTKAPGSDGMSAIFYQKYCDIVGIDVTNMVLNLLNSNASLHDINDTYITLVPKVNMPSKMKDFCLISLSNVAYKLISKVLANRLKSVYPK